MLRPVFFVAAVVAFLAPAQAADPELAGNWLLSYSTGGGGPEQALVIVKIEMKDGKPTISTLNGPLPASGLEIKDGKIFKFHFPQDIQVEGTFGADGKAIASLTSNQFAFRARLTRTDKSEIAASDRIIKVDVPADVSEAQKLNMSVNQIRIQMNREKDADKKKELQEKLETAQKEHAAKEREVVAKHPDTPYALDAAMNLLKSAGKMKMAPDEAKKLLALVEKTAAAYGPRYASTIDVQMVETLASQKGLDAVALPAAEKLTKTLTPTTPEDQQVRVWSTYKMALENAATPNKEAIKTVAATIEKIESKIDAEYMKKVPPFKPTAFAGRKDKAANQVVVMELFTGAQCPPCVAADVAFDALEKTYKPTELVLLQYHLHIPGPDPLTNSDTEARARFYGVNSTPSTFFNGKLQAPGGGGMANSEGKFKQYVAIIDRLLEKTTDVKITGNSVRSGDKMKIAVEVAGAEGDDLKLHLLVVEETIKYVGGNQLRFHHHVVRSMPGGVAGVAIDNKAFKHTTVVDLNDVKKGLTQYLDDKASSMPFPKPDRPLDLKGLHVMVLVQNDKSKEILQALQLHVENEGKSGVGGE